MSFVGEATGALGLLGKAWSLLRDRLDPARAQAKRLIEAFESYGIARQQIPRLLPPELKLPNAAFSTPDKLKDKITPELLDWAAEHLAINRSWLDHASETPHLIEDHYQAPSGYRDWPSKRLEHAHNVHRFLYVWKPLGEELPNARGPLCLIYQETSDSLDGSEFTRYWMLSDQWSCDHPPCLYNLVAVIAVARSLGIWVLGRNVPMAQLERLEAGKMLIPEVVTRHVRSQWHPRDLIDPPPRQDTVWRKALWEEAQALLVRDKVELPNPSREAAGVSSAEQMT